MSKRIALFIGGFMILTSLIFAPSAKADIYASWFECEVRATQTWHTNNYGALKITDIGGEFSNVWVEVARDRNPAHFLAVALTAIASGKNIEVRVVDINGKFYIDAIRILS